MQIIPLYYHLPMDRLWQCKLMLVHTLNHLWQQSLSTSPSPDLLYANEIFPHTLYDNEIFPHPPPPPTHTLPGPGPSMALKCLPLVYTQFTQWKMYFRVDI